MTEWIRFGCCAVCTAVALGCFASEVLGLWKWKSMLCRMHAGAVGDTLGIGAAVLAAVIARGFSMDAAKLLLVALVMLWSSPTASHLLAQMECVASGRAEGRFSVPLEQKGPEDLCEEEEEA